MGLLSLVSRWLPFRRKCCYRCRKPFRAVSDCDAGEIGAFFARLWESQFTCPTCAARFHGFCAQGTDRDAQAGCVWVVCPKCQTRSQHKLPFSVRAFG
jgi:hypothetical protein